MLLEVLDKNKLHHKIHLRARHLISGTAERPSLNVFVGHSHIYAQFSDGKTSVTTTTARTVDKDFERNGGTAADAMLLELPMIEAALGKLIIEVKSLARDGRIKSRALERWLAEGTH